MEFKFDENSHTYTLNGVILPSVTQILESVGVVPDYPIGEYRIRGKMVHKATQLYDNDVIDKYTIGDKIMPYVESYIKSINTFPFEWAHAEAMLYHETYLFAGTVDRIGTYKDHRCIVDFKSGRTSRETGLQLAGYALLVGDKTLRRFKLELQKDGSCGKLTEYKDQADFYGFLGALELHKWKMRGNQKSS